MHKGSCLCGGVRYEIDGRLEMILHCHCSMCRKATGAAFRTRAAVRSSEFRWASGATLVRRYRSSPTNVRTFCGTCGSTLITEFPSEPDWLGLALGTLDTSPPNRPEAHVYVASMASWFSIEDALAQHDAEPPGFGDGS